MTQHLWTSIGRSPTGDADSYVNTVYRPRERLEVWAPAHLPDTSPEIH